MARFHLKKVLFITIVLIILYCWFYVTQNSKYDIYLPRKNFSSVITPYDVQLQGDFLPRNFRKEKLILLFTTHFYSEIWKGLDPENLEDHFRNVRCKIRECQITYDKNTLPNADVVVFHGVDFEYKNYTAKHFQELSKIRPKSQRWVFWMHETPVYYPENDDYNDLFNWTMTFSEQSDIYHPYYSYVRLSKEDERPSKYTNFALGKTKKVAWMVGHCGMTRGEYVTELQKYTDVTVYGLCGASYDNMGGICSKIESECMKELQKYKFYLSFENSFCEDYVTEKYYKFGIMYGLVPIVMGARYNDLNTIPGSYIDVSQFSSIQALGEYINYLDSNDAAYNGYFEWKNHFKMTDGIDKMCLLCQEAHNMKRKEHSHRIFHSFWSKQALCDPYESVVQKLDHQIEHSQKTRMNKD